MFNEAPTKSILHTHYRAPVPARNPFEFPSAWPLFFGRPTRRLAPVGTLTLRHSPRWLPIYISMLKRSSHPPTPNRRQLALLKGKRNLWSPSPPSPSRLAVGTLKTILLCAPLLRLRGAPVGTGLAKEPRLVSPFGRRSAPSSLRHNPHGLASSVRAKKKVGQHMSPTFYANTALFFLLAHTPQRKKSDPPPGLRSLCPRETKSAQMRGFVLPSAEVCYRAARLKPTVRRLVRAQLAPRKLIRICTITHSRRSLLRRPLRALLFRFVRRSHPAAFPFLFSLRGCASNRRAVAFYFFCSLRSAAKKGSRFKKERSARPALAPPVVTSSSY